MTETRPSCPSCQSISVVKCWQSLVDFIEKILREFGENYVINFV